MFLSRPAPCPSATVAERQRPALVPLAAVPPPKAGWPSLKVPPAHLPSMQGVVMLKPTIDGPPSDPDPLTAVKIVDGAASKRQGVVPSRTSKLLNLQGNLKGVFTGDPLSPRRLPGHPGNALFSNTYISMRYGQPVEPCGILLSPEEAAATNSSTVRD